MLRFRVLPMIQSSKALVLGVEDAAGLRSWRALDDDVFVGGDDTGWRVGVEPEGVCIAEDLREADTGKVFDGCDADLFEYRVEGDGLAGDDVGLPEQERSCAEDAVAGDRGDLPEAGRYADRFLACDVDDHTRSVAVKTGPAKTAALRSVSSASSRIQSSTLPHGPLLSRPGWGAMFVE